jgi:hypothetical protein
MPFKFLKMSSLEKLPLQKITFKNYRSAKLPLQKITRRKLPAGKLLP